MDSNREKSKEFVQALRQLADLYDKHPDLQIPTGTCFNVWVEDKSDILQFAKVGAWDKIYADDLFYLRRTFSKDVTLDVVVERHQVCRKVVTGTEVIPARPAREAEPERIVEKFEWICEEPLLKGER